MFNYVLGLVLGFLCGAYLAILVVGDITQWNAMMKCQENLPRNAECVWSQP